MTGVYDRFTDRALKVMRLASQEAQRLNHDYVGPEHILLGLVKEGSGVACNALKNLDIDLRKVRLEVEKRTQPGAATTGRPPFNDGALEVVQQAQIVATELRNEWVGTEHILLALLSKENSAACEVLQGLGLKLEYVREEVLTIFKHKDQLPEPPSPSELPLTQTHCYKVGDQILCITVEDDRAGRQTCRQLGKLVKIPEGFQIQAIVVIGKQKS